MKKIVFGILFAMAYVTAWGQDSSQGQYSLKSSVGAFSYKEEGTAGKVKSAYFGLDVTYSKVNAQGAGFLIGLKGDTFDNGTNTNYVEKNTTYSNASHLGLKVFAMGQIPLLPGIVASIGPSYSFRQFEYRGAYYFSGPVVRDLSVNAQVGLGSLKKRGNYYFYMDTAIPLFTYYEKAGYSGKHNYLFDASVGVGYLLENGLYVEVRQDITRFKKQASITYTDGSSVYTTDLPAATIQKTEFGVGYLF